MRSRHWTAGRHRRACCPYMQAPRVGERWARGWLEAGGMSLPALAPAGPCRAAYSGFQEVSGGRAIMLPPAAASEGRLSCRSLLAPPSGSCRRRERQGTALVRRITRSTDLLSIRVGHGRHAPHSALLSRGARGPHAVCGTCGERTSNSETLHPRRGTLCGALFGHAILLPGRARQCPIEARPTWRKPPCCSARSPCIVLRLRCRAPPRLRCS
jgi:hypothetical protein